MTPLLTAVRYGNIDIVKLLLDKNANTKDKNREEKTCLMLAAEENNVELIEVCQTFYLKTVW